MIALYRHELRKTKATGCDVFVIPDPKGPVSGMAWAVPASADRKGTLHITVTGSVHSPRWLFVLFHEVAHHMLGHTLGMCSRPIWALEMAANKLALQLIRKTQPYAHDLCERDAKAHVRPMLQGFIDAGIFVHGGRAAAKWAGCTLPANP